MAETTLKLIERLENSPLGIGPTQSTPPVTGYGRHDCEPPRTSNAR
jgi:hypothetical protein